MWKTLTFSLRAWRLRGYVRHLELVAADAERDLDFAIQKHSDTRIRVLNAASVYRRELESLTTPNPQHHHQ